MTDVDPREARLLGMDRQITRRDFLNGVATGVATSLVVAANGEPAIAQQPSVDRKAAGVNPVEQQDGGRLSCTTSP